ncbi:MAG: 3-phenylpropionate/trans-cinnamate dioxygenase ferredoxin reductase component [Thermoleophilaceae bacterium]|nr:3-phenylpropionate/trans-cinnamate dioxygenase ferredoxin reductase component [Thermoleophilaceae bacterium]
MADRTFVIVGAALAGAKAAETLREEGFDGRVILLGDEHERPYERPPLSKDYLRGESPRDKAYVHEAGFYEEHDIELRTATTVSAIDIQEDAVELDGGHRVEYDALLVTTGAAPRRLPVEGADLDGVRYLRTLPDSDALGEAIRASSRVAIVGAGWIGSEVAASARQMGTEVALIDTAEVPLERVLGRELGAFYRDVHTGHGVEFLGGTGVERIEGDGRVERVVLSGGRAIEADMVLVGIGVAPRAELAEAAGLEIDNGIKVSASLQTSAPNVYAAGDVAHAWHPLFGAHLRVEHWANALNQGPAAARSMLGTPVSYDRVPYFFSDQYDVGMEYSGHAVGWDSVVIRGDLGAREFIAFWLKDGRVLAGMNVNVWDVTEPIQALVRSGTRVDPGRLAATDQSLEELVAEVVKPPA